MVVSAVVALAFETTMARGDIPSLLALSVAAAIIGFAAGRASPERATGIVLALGYLIPISFFLLHGHFRLWYLAPWKWALICVGAASFRAKWQYPPSLRFALVAWALAIAATWPIIAFRELDWNPLLPWTRPSTPSSSIYAVPSTVWIAQIAQVHLLGLLLADWIIGRFSSRAATFERLLIYPLIASGVVAAGLAVYQGFVDLRFLSIGQWADIGRASGALADGNASGSLTALWVAIPIGIAATSRSRGWTILLCLASAMLFLGVWATGSRTALLGALAGLGTIPHLLFTGSRQPVKKIALAAAFGVIAVAALGAMRPSVVGPVRRAQELLPSLSGPAIRAAAWELWARNGYGLVAVAITRDAPLQGVGVGAFHSVGGQYAFPITGLALPADNAQNWFRHQLAELGVLGSVGWIWWVLLAIALAIRSPVPAAARSRVVALKYTLAGFAAASMLGMPGQSLLVTLTFWALMLWLLLLVLPSPALPAGERTSTTRWSLLAATGLALALAAVTVRSGWNELRPPFRASRFNNGYRYGFHRPFDGQKGETSTSGHGVWVAGVQKRWLKLTVWVEHPDANERPVEVQVWCDHDRVIRGRFPRNVPLTRYVPLPEHATSFVLETRVDRTFRPPDGQPTEVGLQMKWEFVDAAPDFGRAD